MRLRLNPNPWESEQGFRQTLKLERGSVEILGRIDNQPVQVEVWVDVFAPVIHVDVRSQKSLELEAVYESWRNQDRVLSGGDAQRNRTYLGAPIKAVERKDVVAFEGQGILAYHRNDNQSPNAFDVCVEQQGLITVKDQLWNPGENRTFGVWVRGRDMTPSGTTRGRYASTDFQGWHLKSKQAALSHHVAVYAHVDQTETLASVARRSDAPRDRL